MKPKLNSTKYIPFVIVFLVLTMAIGYAVINSVTFDIQGKSQAKTQDGIFITEVKKISSTGTETYETKLAYQNILDGRIELDDNPNSTVSLEISFYNNSEYDYIFEDITYQDDLNDAYSNKNISYSFDSQGETIKIGNPLVITVTFDYLDTNNITDNVLDFILNFKFKPVYIETFAYTGNYQTWTVPFDATYKIELWGSAGGYSENVASETVGKGAYTSGNIVLNKNSKLYIYIGGHHEKHEIKTYFNGGMKAEAGGGGSSDIRLNYGNWDSFESLKSRIMVAAGGGGGVISKFNNFIYFYEGDSPGDAGGLKGYNAYYNVANNKGNYSGYGYSGYGATQISGGLAGNESYETYTEYSHGIFGIGGYDKAGAKASAGGSGYYGGGKGIHTGEIWPGGGGGSSFISGHNGCDAILETSTADNIVHTGQSVHYSNYKFTNTKMIDGRGYSWTNEKGSYVGMPTYDGKSTMKGNEGSGYAKITLIEIK